MKKKKPKKLKIGPSWKLLMTSLEGNPAIEKAFESILSLKERRLLVQIQEQYRSEPERAVEEIRAILDRCKVLHRDLEWLKETFAATELVELMMAIATALHPDRTWDVISQTEHVIVATEERDLVFDLINGHRLSAGASLAFVEDLHYKPTLEEVHEVLRLRLEMIENYRFLLNLMKTERKNSGNNED